MKYKVALYLFIFITKIVFSQTTLSAGDIVIVQYNSDGSPGVEEIKFVALTNMDVGTTINFTDNGWYSNNTFRTTEGVDTWTAPSQIVCGDIITLTFTSISFTTGGDSLIAYQGTLASPSFIYAVNTSNRTPQTDGWQTSYTPASSNGTERCALPLGLVDGSTAVSLPHLDNYKYTGSTTGSKATVLANVSDDTNWTGSNTVNQTFTDTFVTTWDGSAWDGTAGDFLDVIIDGSYSTSSNGDFTACNCTINASNTLTVGSGGTVTVENDITNNGTVNVESGGSVVQVLSSGTASGTDYTVERTSTSQLEEGNYTYWSSPLTSATLADVADAKKYFSYEASTQSWVAASSGTSMSPGVGYISTGEKSITYPSSYTASFSGAAFNTGDISTSINLGTATFVGADDDWNLLGNPYPSAIDADLFTAANTNLNGTIYFWTHATADSAGDNIQADYAMYNTSGGTGGGSQFIASGQGFFVQANATGSVTFTNSMRVAGNNTTFYKGQIKNRKIEAKDRIWLSLKTHKTKNQILVGFFEEATDGVDRLYDGLKLNAGAETNFYSLIDNKEYGIQGKSSLKEVEEIPLGFSASKADNFTISIDKFEGKLDDSNIFINDTFLKVKHNLKKSDYAFTSDEAGEFNNRFNLIIETNSEVLTVDDYVSESKIIIENNQKGLVLKTIDNTIINKVIVYNILGEKIIAKENRVSEVEINSNVLKANSILIVKTLLDNGEVSINKIIKN